MRGKYKCMRVKQQKGNNRKQKGVKKILGDENMKKKRYKHEQQKWRNIDNVVNGTGRGKSQEIKKQNKKERRKVNPKRKNSQSLYVRGYNRAKKTGENGSRK